MVAQQADELGFGDRVVVRANQDSGDGPLHVHRFGERIQARDFVQAERLARSSLRLNRMHSSTWRMLTVALVSQGKLGEAAAAMRELRRLEPELTVASYLARTPNGKLESGRQWAEAMSVAGLPRGI